MNMEFSSLVLIERDKATNHIIREMGSYEVSGGSEYITKLYYDGESVHLFFDTGRDVEEWEFSAIFDLFDSESFEDKGYEIEDDDDQYNPTWHVKLGFDEDHEAFKEKLNEICGLIEAAMEKVFSDIQGKEAEYD
jgi:hypothetical protein